MAVVVDETDGLALQDLENLKVETLTPLTPEVISRQATVNIGTIGHVAHGKSTVVRAISGVQTVRFKNELERNITIKLGYANAKIYRCSDNACPRPQAYRAYGSNKCDEPLCEVRTHPRTYIHISYRKPHSTFTYWEEGGSVFVITLMGRDSWIMHAVHGKRNW